MSRVYFVIPAYNEETGVRQVVEGAGTLMRKMNRDYTCIVVNDGSRDRTQEVAEELQKTHSVVIIRHPQNQNVGAVFRNGLTRAAELARAGDVIITTEGDNTCAPDIFEQMIMQIDAGRDVVAATRYAAGARIEGFSRMRRIYSWGINTLLRTFYPIRGISDYSIFMRAWKAELLQAMLEYYGGDFIESVGFVANAEILIKARPFRPDCASVPMLYRYSAKVGGSKINIKKTIFEYFKFFVRLRNCRKRLAGKPLPARG